MIRETGAGWIRSRTPAFYLIAASEEEHDPVVLGALFGAALAVHDLMASGARVEWDSHPRSLGIARPRTVYRTRVTITPLDESVPTGGRLHRLRARDAWCLAARYSDRISAAMSAQHRTDR